MTMKIASRIKIPKSKIPNRINIIIIIIYLLTKKSVIIA